MRMTQSYVCGAPVQSAPQQLGITKKQGFLEAPWKLRQINKKHPSSWIRIVQEHQRPEPSSSKTKLSNFTLKWKKDLTLNVSGSFNGFIMIYHDTDFKWFTVIRSTKQKWFLWLLFPDYRLLNTVTFLLACPATAKSPGSNCSVSELEKSESGPGSEISHAVLRCGEFKQTLHLNK